MQKFTKQVRVFTDYGSTMLEENNLDEVLKKLLEVRAENPNKELLFDTEWDYGNVEVTYIYYEEELEGEELEAHKEDKRSRDLDRIETLKQDIARIERGHCDQK